MNNAVANIIESPFPVRHAPAHNALVEIEGQRAIAETQAAMVVAKKFPRDQAAAMNRILQACTRPALAESAQYQYARGGTDITGPSIRMAETLAREWGNMQYGIRELSQANGESEVEAYAWDIETNTRQVKVFKVPHVRHTKGGSKPLTDPRDIYETVANNGARRLRSCILGVIPGDVVEAAMKQCEITLKTNVELTPDVVKKMLDAFDGIGVTKAMIEKRLQRNIDAITPAAFVQLRKIFNSIKDGMGSAADFFEADNLSAVPAKGTAGLRAAVKPNDAKAEKVNKETGEITAEKQSEGPDIPALYQDALAAAKRGDNIALDLARNLPADMAAEIKAEFDAEKKGGKQ